MLPSLVVGLVTWWGVGALNRAGVPLIWSFTLLLVGFFVALGCLAVAGARRESPRQVASRLWLSPFKVGDVVLGLVVGIAGLLAYRSLQGLTGWFMGIWPFGFPSWAPHFAGDGTFFDVPLAQNSWLIIVFVIIYMANVVGEELWWRGYILPRQVGAMGKNAWVANGLLWSFFHVFQAWDIISLIPIALGIAFMSQYRMSVWLAITAHAVLNCQAWVGFVGQIMESQ